MTTATKRTGTYNGKPYEILFLGNTKYGRRAHLKYLDGTKDFWVNAGLVTEGGTPAPARSGYSPRAGRRRNEDDRCEVCDENKWTCGHCVGW